MSASGAARSDSPGWYEIRLNGHLAPRWSTWFADLTVIHGPDGTTVIRGPVADQAALHGVLARLRDVGLPLISIHRLPTEPAPDRPPCGPTIGD